MKKEALLDLRDYYFRRRGRLLAAIPVSAQSPVRRAHELFGSTQLSCPQWGNTSPSIGPSVIIA
jgi:hypothetical protein